MSDGKCEAIGSAGGTGSPTQPRRGYWVKDISAKAEEVGFPYPVLITTAAWDACFRQPDDCLLHDEKSRLAALLHALDDALSNNYLSTGEVRIVVHFDNSPEKKTAVSLRAVIRVDASTEETTLLLMLAEEE